MATPTQDTQPPFVPPPGELPSVQLWQPKPPQRKYPPWVPWLALALSPVILICTAVGAFTIASWAVNGAASNASHTRPAATTEARTQTVKPHKTKPTVPAYDLAGYKAVVTGSDEQTYVVALDRFRHDIRGLQFQTVKSDSLTLSGAANAYLTDLRKTNPPPAYQAAKLANVTSAVYARRAAATIQSAISSANLASLQTGLAQANKAKAALAQAVAAMPKGS